MKRQFINTFFEKTYTGCPEKPVLFLNDQRDNSNHRHNRHAKSFPQGIRQAYIRTCENQSKHN